MLKLEHLVWEAPDGEGIIKDIEKVVADKCVTEGYVLVIDKSGKTLNNIPTVVYHNPALDITTPVIKTPDEPNFGQLEDRVNGMADVETFVFHNGESVQDIPFPGLPDNIDTTLRLMNK